MVKKNATIKKVLSSPKQFNCHWLEIYCKEILTEKVFPFCPSTFMLSPLLTCVYIGVAAVDMEEVESLQFDFETVKTATNNFSDDNKLGQGGFGAVYKVTYNIK